MPTYEYECDACQHNFDEFQSFTEKPLKKCPKCGKPKLRRLFGSGAGFIFKGSGFYQTDYRSESYQAAAKAEQPAADKSSDTGEKSSAKADTNGTTAKAGASSGKAGKKMA